MSFPLETYLAAAAICDAASGKDVPALCMFDKIRDLAERKYFPIIHPGQHDILIETAKNEILAAGQAMKLDVSADTWGWEMSASGGTSQAVREFAEGLEVRFIGCLIPARLLLRVEVGDIATKGAMLSKCLTLFNAEVSFSHTQTVQRTQMDFGQHNILGEGIEPAFYKEIVKTLRQFRRLAYFPYQENVAHSLQAMFSRSRPELKERS